MADEKKPHFFLKDTKEEVKYQTTNAVLKKRVFPDRNKQGLYLHQKYEQVLNELTVFRSKNPNANTRGGDYIEFAADKKLFSLDAFENKTEGITLLNIKTKDKKDELQVTVFIPENKASFYSKKINAYATENTEKGKPKFQSQIAQLTNIALSELNDLWLDDISLLPDGEKKWCEIWFHCDEDSNSENYCNNIKAKLANFKIQYGDNFISFPEKKIFLCYVDKNDLLSMVIGMGYISEIHLFKEPASFFTNENSILENKQWEKDLLKRVRDSENRIRVCILDTGLAHNHPLLKDVVDETDAQVEQLSNATTNADIDGHGTEMAGLCEYFDLQKALESTEDVKRNIQLESVKIFQINNPKPNPPEFYGLITQNAVNMAQATHNSDNRVHCLAITEDAKGFSKGEPSSWSGYLDNIIYGSDDNKKKLFVVSAGNGKIKDIAATPYPEGMMYNSVQSPAQAWNALSVGAISTKTIIKEPSFLNFKPVAPMNELCPFSTTSLDWSNKWPIKPEVLFEGGNAYTDGHTIDSCDDLSLLTTSRQSISKIFTTINATSSATAQAANVAAEIYFNYPNLWAETVRALIVHSAEWPKDIILKYKNKTERRELLRCYGYGIGNKQRAINCLKNKAVMIIEDVIKPFGKNEKKNITMNTMNLHKLPWPKEFLLSLDSEKVRVKITLSYFIEAAPDNKGWLNKYRYQSAGLVFDMQRPSESLKSFTKRISKAQREEDYKKGTPSADNWFLGCNNRDVGSIHSDYWEGKAFELSTCENIAVYPITGWWKTRDNLGKYNEKLRYSLIVSLETCNPDIDIYNAVKTAIETTVKTTIVV